MEIMSGASDGLEPSYTCVFFLLNYDAQYIFVSYVRYHIFKSHAY